MGELVDNPFFWWKPVQQTPAALASLIKTEVKLFMKKGLCSKDNIELFQVATLKALDRF